MRIIPPTGGECYPFRSYESLCRYLASTLLGLPTLSFPHASQDSQAGIVAEELPTDRSALNGLVSGQQCSHCFSAREFRATFPFSGLRPSKEDREKKLYVGNISFQTTSDDLVQAFSQYGTVLGAQIVSDRETGRSRGFAFVEMHNGADEAIAGPERRSSSGPHPDRQRGQAPRGAAPDRWRRRRRLRRRRPRWHGGGGGGYGVAAAAAAGGTEAIRYEDPL